MKFLITGGAGFIGSALIRYIIHDLGHSVVNVDKLTYAGNLESLNSVSENQHYWFEHVDICDYAEVERVFGKHKPDKVIHLAAESHVDRSIDGPVDFINTNIAGTYVMLEVARQYWTKLKNVQKSTFCFHHVSTDEVYGDLENTEHLFSEDTPYAPSSPYSASKASSDHLVRAWNRTYGLPIVITNCSNNYGPYQFPEKLIPLVILNALTGKPLPVYGSGKQVRDWLYVEDHVKALVKVAEEGKIGDTYNIGGHNEKTNLDVVMKVCSILDVLAPKHPGGIDKYEDLITFVKDRPGHDLRYAIDANKIKEELGWIPEETFESGMEKTVEWYLDNHEWCQHIIDGGSYNDRLGTL